MKNMAEYLKEKKVKVLHVQEMNVKGCFCELNGLDFKAKDYRKKNFHILSWKTFQNKKKYLGTNPSLTLFFVFLNTFASKRSWK